MYEYGYRYAVIYYVKERQHYFYAKTRENAEIKAKEVNGYVVTIME